MSLLYKSNSWLVEENINECINAAFSNFWKEFKWNQITDEEEAVQWRKKWDKENDVKDKKDEKEKKTFLTQN